MDTATPNRYAPPGAVVDDIATGVQPVRLWPPRGRMGRLRFLAYGIAVWLLSSLFAFLFGLAAGFSGANPMFVQVVSVVVYFGLAAVLLIQRSHDMDFSGWWSLLSLIPFVGLYWLFKGGTPGPNRFGAPPPPNSTAVVVVGWIAGVLFAIGAIGIVAAVVLPGYQAFSQRAKPAV